MVSSDPEARRGLIVSRNKLAGYLIQRGDKDDVQRARDYLVQDIEHGEALLQADPESIQVKRDLSISLISAAQLLSSRSQTANFEQSRLWLEYSVELSEEVLSVSPTSPKAARDLSKADMALSFMLTIENGDANIRQAQFHIDRSIALSERLLNASPDSVQAIRDLARALERRAALLAQSKIHDERVRALMDQRLSLSLCRKFSSNGIAEPHSLFRSLVESIYVTGLLERAIGSIEHADDLRSELKGLLESWVARGKPLDDVMRQRLKELQDPAST